jgi:hypothetical protein
MGLKRLALLSSGNRGALFVVTEHTQADRTKGFGAAICGSGHQRKRLANIAWEFSDVPRYELPYHFMQRRAYAVRPILEDVGPPGEPRHEAAAVRFNERFGDRLGLDFFRRHGCLALPGYGSSGASAIRVGGDFGGRGRTRERTERKKRESSEERA